MDYIALLGSMVVGPMLTPFVAAGVGAAGSYILQALGIHYELLSTTIDKPQVDIAVKRLSVAGWGQSRSVRESGPLISSGLFVSREYRAIGWLSEVNTASHRGGSDRELSMHLLCSDVMRQRLTAPEAAPVNTETGATVAKLLGKDVTCYKHSWRVEYFTRELQQAPVLQVRTQTLIASAIIAEIEFGVCALIHGPPGTGKSAVASCVAATLSAAGRAPVIVRGYSPGVSGMAFYDIISRFPPTHKAPMILCFEEFDCLVDTILSEHAQEPKGDPAETTNKANLSSYLDRLATIPHLAVIATGNASLDWWDAPERAFVTRPGRFMLRMALEPLSAADTATVFESGLRCYKLAGEVPRFVTPYTAAQLAEAFKRAHGDVRRVYAALGCWPA
jgi:hypothetical protein